MNDLSAILRRISVVLAVFAMVTVSACKTAQKTEEGAPTAPSVEENALGDSDSGRAMGMETVHFPYDAFTLTDEAKSVLKANAGIMKDKPGVKIQIEGHCDQRGGIQYNIALGEKRAKAVMRYMVDLGVSADRLTTISYGKERPIDPGTSEESYAKNRRANFVITSQ